MYYLDLFAGIGGFAPGAYPAGLRFEGHYFSEVDDYVVSVYKKRFPDAVVSGDIRNIRASDLPEGDRLFTGGFPCQDISLDGKRKGLAGEHSRLWFEYARLIKEVRPEVCLIENVPRLAKQGLYEVLTSLDQAGYNAEQGDIRASDVKAPRKRERLRIIF